MRNVTRPVRFLLLSVNVPLLNFPSCLTPLCTISASHRPHPFATNVALLSPALPHSQDSVVIANSAGERLVSVTQRIGEIDGMNQSVATATEEQTSVVESINMDITEINTLNQEGVENLQSTLRACTDLEQQAARLKQLVGSFRI